MSLIEKTGVINKDIYTKYLENEIEYFESIRQPEMLIEEITDNVNVGSNSLTGLSFPLCNICEGLGALSSFYGSKRISLLEELLTTRLYENYKNYGFNYFNEGYIPLDLDTVSSITRILGERYTDVLVAYNEIIDRNLNKNGLVPTWLDTDDHEHWCSGNSKHHIDVMLNHWLTEVNFNYGFDVELLKNTIALRGLKNYWYIPSLYTPYLYYKLLKRLRLLEDVTYLGPLVKVIEEYSTNSSSYHRRSNATEIKIVQDLVKQNRCKQLDDFLFNTMLNNIELKNDYKGIAFLSPISMEMVLAKPFRNEALYWSLGFKLYNSEITVKSILLDCLTTIISCK